MEGGRTIDIYIYIYYRVAGQGRHLTHKKNVERERETNESASLDGNKWLILSSADASASLTQPSLAFCVDIYIYIPSTSNNHKRKGRTKEWIDNIQGYTGVGNKPGK